jgi:hypothetical protein
MVSITNALGLDPDVLAEEIASGQSIYAAIESGDVSELLGGA